MNVFRFSENFIYMVLEEIRLRRIGVRGVGGARRIKESRESPHYPFYLHLTNYKFSRLTKSVKIIGNIYHHWALYIELKTNTEYLYLRSVLQIEIDCTYFCQVYLVYQVYFVVLWSSCDGYHHFNSLKKIENVRYFPI